MYHDKLIKILNEAEITDETIRIKYFLDRLEDKAMTKVIKANMAIKPADVPINLSLVYKIASILEEKPDQNVPNQINNSKIEINNNETDETEINAIENDKRKNFEYKNDKQYNKYQNYQNQRYNNYQNHQNSYNNKRYKNTGDKSYPRGAK